MEKQYPISHIEFEPEIDDTRTLPDGWDGVILQTAMFIFAIGYRIALQWTE